MKKIGIYPGTFDPVHSGHITFAKKAVQECGLDKVYLLVEPRPRRKQGVKAFEHRIEMVRLAVHDEPDIGSIVLGQQRFTTSETMPLLAKRFKGSKLYLLLGDDVLKYLNVAHWPDLDELVRGVKIAVGLREMDRQEFDEWVLSVKKTTNLKLEIKAFEIGQNEVSSRSIKRKLKKGMIPEQVHPEVLHYIREHNLYFEDK